MKIVRYKSFQKGTLVAIVSVELERLGMQFNDIAVHVKGDQKWCNMPSKKYEDAQGQTKYAPYIWFTEDKMRDDFQRKLFEALLEYEKNNPQKEAPQVAEELPF